MKRGYMDRNAALVPDAMLHARQAALAALFEAAGVDAAIVYGDASSADELQYLSGLGPYWGNATCVINKQGERHIIAGMTARVNFWIAMTSGLDESEVQSAGPSVPRAVAKYLQENFAGGTIGIIGEYFPDDVALAIEAAGIKTVVIDGAVAPLLRQRDDGAHATMKKGVELMTGAIPGAMKGAGTDGRTMQSVAADVEYACRTAGAMDTLILAGDEDLVFFQAPDEQAKGAYTLYMQLQYLGEWMCITRSTDAARNSEAFAVRARALAALRAGFDVSALPAGGFEVSLCPLVRADHPVWNGGAAAAGAGQICSLRVRSREKGIVIEDMVEILADGAKLLTDI